MRRKLTGQLALLFAAVLFAGGGLAQELQEITVEATRVETSKASTVGIVPEYLLRASYRVTYDDLDVSTLAGREEVKRRVEQAADLACREIEREYPFAEPDHLKCAYDAAREAMAEFRTQVAAR